MASLSSTSNQESKELTDTSYITRLPSELNDLRLEGRFCDVTIVAGDHRLQAHKLVLSCATSYFRSMFSSNWEENESREVEVPGSGESFKPILDFAYTGTFKVSVHTGIGVLGLACYMGFTEVMAACGGYLIDVVEYFSLDDCLKIWSHARCHVLLIDLAQCYRKHLVNRFVECIQSQLCLECSPVDFLLEGLCDEEIEDSCTEEQILQLTISWLRYKWEHRKSDTINVLRKMRLGMIPGDRLKGILGDEILAIPECKALVDEVVKLQATTEQAEVPLMISKPDLFATRNTITAAVCAEDKQGHALYVGCIDNTGCYKLTQMADIPAKSPFFEEENEEEDCFSHGFTLIVTHTGHLYVAGGNRNGLSFLDGEEEERYQKWVSANNFFRYDWDRNEWRALPPMLTVQFLPILLQVKDYLYCIEYHEYFEPVMMIQRYSLSHQTWECVSGHTLRGVTSALVFDGCILFQSVFYIPGSENYRFVIFKPDENRWCEVAVHTNENFSAGRSYGGGLVVHKSICYFKKVFRESDMVEVIRLVCNLKNDEPTITFAEMVDPKEAFGSDACGADPTLFTFDKRKLGMTRVPCRCTAHKE